MNETLEVEKNIIEHVSLSGYLFIKRVFDIFASFIGIIALIIVAIVVKIIYLINKDTSSIFYTQERIGKNGKTFKLYKLRSMVPNADEELYRYLKKNKKAAREYKINKKLKNDPRVTKIGKVLRKTSLDELPQILNIFKGDMSLIGNRPYLPREMDDIGSYLDTITSTKPGLTGYWQVSGRSDTTFQERLELESFYSKNCNLKMDIKIFLKTFKVVLLKKGAK